jgi:nucleoside-diphosphate-sugar epimerase
MTSGTAGNSPARVSTVLLGCGYTLRRLAAILPEGTTVLTSRSPGRVEGWIEEGFSASVVDTQNRTHLSELLKQYPDVHTIVDSVPPQFGDPETSPNLGVRNLLSAIAGTSVERIVYLSTTGVFGVEDGSPVDEATPARPSNPRSLARLEAEDLYRSGSVSSVVLRLPAIYGPGRGIGLSLRDGTYRLVESGSRWSNRIHVHDLVEVLARITMGSELRIPPLLCVTDDRPARSSEVVRHYCQTLGLPHPREISLDEAVGRGMHTLLSNQRVSNRLMKSLLGVTLRYPSYVEGAGTEFEVDSSL